MEPLSPRHAFDGQLAVLITARGLFTFISLCILAYRCRSMSRVPSTWGRFSGTFSFELWKVLTVLATLMSHDCGAQLLKQNFCDEAGSHSLAYSNCRGSQAEATLLPRRSPDIMKPSRKNSGVIASYIEPLFHGQHELLLSRGHTVTVPPWERAVVGGLVLCQGLFTRTSGKKKSRNA